METIATYLAQLHKLDTFTFVFHCELGAFAHPDPKNLGHLGEIQALALLIYRAISKACDDAGREGCSIKRICFRRKSAQPEIVCHIKAIPQNKPQRHEQQPGTTDGTSCNDTDSALHDSQNESCDTDDPSGTKDASSEDELDYLFEYNSSLTESDVEE
ncbi:hypothetical protein P171DRAFT_432082 [Karstenula rhodostoma CBS 690.94]|uniref:Uncharacterized protein n=1 Tax=Karstenula rhodostoma CBS 690.94 TaxID=1392251 RepID=A0A9P4UC56_9PLEO|nr:hypothetical protein P171DRAFT_432082 [Karstenula rhodostoma CBS 690.94]